ncbi:MAG: peptidoglycan-binding protein [Solirubrobacterales bacterium]
MFALVGLLVAVMIIAGGEDPAAPGQAQVPAEPTQVREAVTACAPQANVPAEWAALVPDPASRMPRIAPVKPAVTAAVLEVDELFVPPVAEQNDPDTVRMVQTRLREAGYDVPRTDGHLDRDTRRAIMEFQRDRRLVPTGWIKELLLKNLDTPKVEAPVAEIEEQVTPPSGTWPLSRMVGMSVHALPGDRLGSVSDVVLSGGCALGAVMESQGRGLSGKQVLLPWGVVADQVGHPAILLPLSPDRADRLMTQAPAFRLGEGRTSAVALRKIGVRSGAVTVGQLDDVTFDQSGAIHRFVVSRPGNAVPEEVEGSKARLRKGFVETDGLQ